MSSGASSGANSFVSVADSTDFGTDTSGFTGAGFQGLGNSGWTVNFGGKGVNLQGGATEMPSLAGIPWLWIAAGVAAWFLLKRR